MTTQDKVWLRFTKYTFPVGSLVVTCQWNAWVLFTHMASPPRIKSPQCTTLYFPCFDSFTNLEQNILYFLMPLMLKLPLGQWTGGKRVNVCLWWQVALHYCFARFNPLTYTCTYKLYLPQRKQLQEDMIFLAGHQLKGNLSSFWDRCALQVTKDKAGSQVEPARSNFRGK